MSFCLVYDAPSNDLWISERQWGMTDQQVIGGFGNIIFEGTYDECQERYNKETSNVTYAVYYHNAIDKYDNSHYYIVAIKDGGGSYQDNAVEHTDNWVRSFDTKKEAENYIAE